MTDRKCAACGESSAFDARFCEACGAVLETPPTSAPTGGPGACVDCNAAASQIGTDGYCQVCGRKQPAPHDHEELVLAGVVAVTDRGITHHRNEDAYVCGAGDGIVAVMVCDGVSSTADSDLAAINATAAGRDHAMAQLAAGASVLDAVRGAIAPAQAAAAAVPRVVGEKGDTASCTAVFFAAKRQADGTYAGAAAWLGDSRAYIQRGAVVEQISVDDSWATEQIAVGMDEATAFADPRCHSITRWLGADATDVAPTTREFIVNPADRVIVMSDGLWNYAQDLAAMTTLLTTVGAASDLASAQALVDFANAQGGHDNITVAIATFDPSTPTTTPASQEAQP